jgi:hypothetical protein
MDENILYNWVFLHQRLVERINVVDFVWDEGSRIWVVVRKQAKEPITEPKEIKEQD